MKDIGELFGVTRMRICQIEKEVIVKLNKLIKIN
ncbi:MAG: sigma factor-like helix-turn-helix DNA-binding protein [Myxococcota bacterium]